MRLSYLDHNLKLSPEGEYELDDLRKLSELTGEGLEAVTALRRLCGMLKHPHDLLMLLNHLQDGLTHIREEASELLELDDLERG